MQQRSIGLKHPKKEETHGRALVGPGAEIWEVSARTALNRWVQSATSFWSMGPGLAPAATGATCCCCCCASILGLMKIDEKSGFHRRIEGYDCNDWIWA